MAGPAVRVDPPSVEFHDVTLGQVFNRTITATNVGRSLRKIFIEKPKLKAFSFSAASPAAVVAPGLSVSWLLEFSPEREEDVQDQLLIHVEDLETITIPLLGFARTCKLQVDSVLDFGCIVANCQIVSKRHPITNQGAAPGSFQVHYTGDPTVKLWPCNGTIAAGATQWLKVELCTDKPRQIQEEAVIKLQNGSSVRLRIKAKLVEQQLEVFDMQGAPLSCLWFRPAYFGTSSTKYVILRNNAPQACNWVSVVQDNAAGTEVGTDLCKRTDAALLDLTDRASTRQDVSQVLVCVPKEGRLGPFEQGKVAIRFNPVGRRLIGKTKQQHSGGRQDFCVFVLFDSVESRHGLAHTRGGSSVELAVTGSGLPVSLATSPHRLDFPPCVMGQCVHLECVLHNLCAQLPAHFQFRKVAHFTTKPSTGTIAPGQRQQQGNFKVQLLLDVLGHGLDQANGNTDVPELCSVHTITLQLSAVCHSETKRPAPELSSGTGRCHAVPHAAILCSSRTQLHAHHLEKSQTTEKEFLVSPKDRASSIRPASSPTRFRTTCTHGPRNRYVDTNYAFTEEEEDLRQQHQQVYTDFIKRLRQTRLSRGRIKEKKQKEVENDVDIGIIPSQGLVPPEPCISEIQNSNMEGKLKNQYTGSKCSHPGDIRSITQKATSQVLDEISAVPTNDQEVVDCGRTLTAQELFRVSIGPALVDFGEVCVQSTSVQMLELINHLSVNIWVQLELGSPELRGSSPLSHVLPPHSQNTCPLMFQSTRPGHFYRPLSYSINQHHFGQILVQAQVVPLTLELSTNHLVLSPTPPLLAQSEYRGSVTLRNRHNLAAEFTWRPVVTEGGIMFSVRPAAGTVEPHRELDCEVVWHPSFSSPDEGDFDLCVHDGNTQRLHCTAKVGFSNVKLAEKHVTYGSVPLNLLSTRTAVLHNTGANHAYYQVLDVCPLPGMLVSPSEGVVPSGGQTAIKINFTPESVVRFDSRVEIALRNMKSTELRLSGSVEHPNVEISVSCFQFYGVFAGSQRLIPFTLTNRSSAAAQVSVNLSEYPEFSLQAPGSSAEKEPGVSVVEMQGYQTVNCSLGFFPIQAATHAFDLPVTVNGVRWPPSSASSTSSPVAAGSTKPIQLPSPVAMAAQQSWRIQATALSAPLEMSPCSLQFHVTPASRAHTKTLELKTMREDDVCWRSIGSKQLNWWIGCKATAAREAGAESVFTASPSSGSLGPGQSVTLSVSIRPEAAQTLTARMTRLSLALYLDGTGEGTGVEERHLLYRELSITISLQLPSISIHPRHVLLMPVPLKSSAACTLTLTAVGYPCETTVSAEVDEVKLEDGKVIQPVSVSFPEGNCFPAQTRGTEHPGVYSLEPSGTSLMCSVCFHSDVPLSFCTNLTFTDHLNNQFKVKLYAAAENCLLTAWPYIAHPDPEQQIVLKTGATAVETILQRYQTPSSGLASSSSSFDHSSSTNKNSDSLSASGDTCRNEEASPNITTSPSIPGFTDASLNHGHFYQNVVLAVQRWFSLFGWPGGPHPVSIPNTLRRVISQVHMNHSSKRTYRVVQNKDCRSVVDMLHHLTGTQVPGVPHCQTFSRDLDQRTNQLLQQHEAVLAFLRVQGASLCHIRPEYLLDVEEYKHWSLQSDPEKPGVIYKSTDYESLSKRSWTDVLLQVYKVLVLRRVSENSLNIVSTQKESDPVNSKSLVSNIYSASELQLLSWLNQNYQNMREPVWRTGVIPSSRWIVNFDLDLTDGLVLGAVLAAYCPYLINSHFRRMYTTTNSLEQVLHNNIIVVQALTALSLNIDIKPTDLSDPNPLQMVMLCVHLFERLPQYLPQHNITLSGGLHSTFTKQVHLKNPSSNPVKYQALLLGEDAGRFSLPSGSAVTIPPKGRTEVIVHYSCSVLQPMTAVLLLTSRSASGLHSRALAFSLQTSVTSHPPVVLVESTFNPLGPKKTKDSLIEKVSSKASTEKNNSNCCGEDTDDKVSGINGTDSEFLSPVRTVHLKSGQSITLSIHYLPFCPGTKFCSVLLVCPQVGDMVYILKATAELPLPSLLTARPSSNICSIPMNSESSVLVSVLRLRCKVQQVCVEVLRVPLVNMAWERALVEWGQRLMSASERRRRILTHTLHSSSVRATTAARKLLSKVQLMNSADQAKAVEYSVEVSLPKYFTLPSTVRIPVEEDTSVPWENPAACGCVNIPLRFQADSVGQFTCQVVLKSWCDTRVYTLEAVVTPQTVSVHLDFSSPAHHSVTQDIPLYNETDQDWNLKAEIHGKGFCGPEMLNIAAGTKACYPLTFLPSTQCVVKGKLSLCNKRCGTEHTFTLRGVGEPPLPVDHLVVQCTVGKTMHTQVDVPNYSQNKLTLKFVTDLLVVSGIPSLEIEPGQSAPYTLAVTPQIRGKQTGCVAFVDSPGTEEADKDTDNVLGHYEVFFTLEIICQPAAPVKVIHVQCVAQSSATIELPVSNPGAALLELNVSLEGDNLSGVDSISVAPGETLTYKATFSPDVVGKSTGSVVFQSELLGEVWYQLELYALPPAVSTLPPVCCQLGKWTRLTLPLVNPEAEALEMTVTNSNPRNYTLEMNSGNTLMVEPHSSTQLMVEPHSSTQLLVEPHSSTQLLVRFSPSSIGEGNHTTKITFTSSKSQRWCVLLRGLGLHPEIEEPLSISSVLGSAAHVTVPFTNPTELPGQLSVTLTDEDPTTSDHHPGITQKEVFSTPLSCTEGIQISEGASFDVPVVFAPASMELQQAWLRITMKALRRPGSSSSITADSGRSEQEVSDVCWIYPLRGIPMERPVQSTTDGEIQCEASCQLEKKVDVLLSGCVLGNQDHRVSQVPVEDFMCEVREAEADSAVDDCLVVTPQAAGRNPETGVITLTLNLLYAPLRPHRRSVMLTVRYLSGQTWEFPLRLIATEAKVDDVIVIETAAMETTSAVGFRLTSTTRRPEPFSAAFLSGSSSEFTVSPASGTLPPIGSRGALITVSFTPSSHNERHRARLSVQAADMQWTYEVRGRTPLDALPPVGPTSSRVRAPRRNFVAHNLRLPSLANSSPLKLPSLL